MLSKLLQHLIPRLTGVNWWRIAARGNEFAKRAMQRLHSLISLSYQEIDHNLVDSNRMETIPQMATCRACDYSEYAHISFMLYRQHGTSFMSNQLYGDSRVMVKNSFFYLAKQILMDPTLPVLLTLTGDDRLGNLGWSVDIKTLLETC
jgi:hypothetical protein